MDRGKRAFAGGDCVRVRDRPLRLVTIDEAASDPTVGRAAARWLFAGLLLWGVGVEVTEILASLGMIVCALSVAAIYLRKRSRKEIGELLFAGWPLALFFGWSIARPALAGRLPAPTGLGRAFDGLLIPSAASPVRALPERQ